MPDDALQILLGTRELLNQQLTLLGLTCTGSGVGFGALDAEYEGPEGLRVSLELRGVDEIEVAVRRARPDSTEDEVPLLQKILTNVAEVVDLLGPLLAPGAASQDQALMLVVYGGFDALFIATAQDTLYADDEHEPGRSITRHLNAGGRVEVISLTPKWDDGGALCMALSAVLRGERTQESLGTVVVEASYVTLEAYLREEE